MKIERFSEFYPSQEREIINEIVNIFREMKFETISCFIHVNAKHCYVSYQHDATTEWNM